MLAAGPGRVKARVVKLGRRRHFGVALTLLGPSGIRLQSSQTRSQEVQSAAKRTTRAASLTLATALLAATMATVPVRLDASPGDFASRLDRAMPDLLSRYAVAGAGGRLHGGR